MTKFVPNNSTILRLTAVVLLILLASPASASFQTPQDIQFRLINIERRLDQLQQRVDFLERSIQSAAAPAAETTVLTQAILETQRQQLMLAEQVVMMQKQMLEMQKKIDQLREKPEPKKN